MADHQEVVGPSDLESGYPVIADDCCSIDQVTEAVGVGEAGSETWDLIDSRKTNEWVTSINAPVPDCWTQALLQLCSTTYAGKQAVDGAGAQHATSGGRSSQPRFPSFQPLGRHRATHRKGMLGRSSISLTASKLGDVRSHTFRTWRAVPDASGIPTRDHTLISIFRLFDDVAPTEAGRDLSSSSNASGNGNGKDEIDNYSLLVASVVGTLGIISVDRKSLSGNGTLLVYLVAALNIVSYFLCYFGSPRNQITRNIQALLVGFTFLGALCLVFPDSYIWWATTISWSLWICCLVAQYLSRQGSGGVAIQLSS